MNRWNWPFTFFDLEDKVCRPQRSISHVEVGVEDIETDGNCEVNFGVDRTLKRLECISKTRIWKGKARRINVFIKARNYQGTYHLACNKGNIAAHQ